jgi:hypothetical protein
MVEAARTGAWSYLQQGSTAEALRLAETGLSEADHDPDLLAAASKAAWMIGLLPLAIEHGRGWHAQAAAGGDPGAEAAALVHLARLHWEAKDFQRQWQTVWAALRVAEPLGESEPLARAYSLAAEAHMLNEQHAEAVRWADKALAMAEAVGCPAVRAAALVNKGTALADRVDGHDEGVALLERAVAEAEAGDFGYVLHRALYNLLVQQVDVWPPSPCPGLLARRPPLRPGPGRGLDRSLLDRPDRGRPAAGGGPARPGRGAPAAPRRPDGGRGRPSWRPRATRPPPWTPTGRCSTTTSSTGPRSCWPTATRAPPAACSPLATRRAPPATPAGPPACSTAGPAGAATRSPPSSPRPLQRRDRPPPLHLHQDRLGPRLQHPGQAQHDLPHRGRHLGRPHGPGPPRVGRGSGGGGAP